MADVFISYARADETIASRLTEVLRGHGYEAWRDDELPAHRAYAEVIEERLKDAKAVVVLWSAEAAKSQWVRAEADAARGAGTLVQVSLDETIPPLPFNQIQCANCQVGTGRRMRRAGASFSQALRHWPVAAHRQARRKRRAAHRPGCRCACCRSPT
jgi:adenylate cyclase